MTKEEYLKELNKALKRLPREERGNAVSYYREYFEDAGDEQKVIEELGKPKELARKILIECAEKNLDEENGEGKKNAWLVLLGVMALPISPVLLSVTVLLILCVFIVIGCMILSGAAVAVSGVFMVIIGIGIIGTENALLSIGCGLTFMALGVLILSGFKKMWGWFGRTVKNRMKKIFVRKNDHLTESDLHSEPEQGERQGKYRRLTGKAALCVLPVGMILFIAGFMISDNRNFYVKWEDGRFKYGAMEYDKWKVDYTELEPFENIQVNAACGDISMKPAESWGISYVIYGEEPSCEVLDNTLYVNFKGSDNSDTGFAFYLDFEIPNGSQDSELCIYYPKEEAANLKNMNIVTEYGDISLEQLVCDSVQIKNECGDVAVNSSAFQNSSIEMDYGDLDASKTDFGNADIKLTCGDLQIEEGQACDMNIDAEYGDMKIRLLNPENVKYGYDIKTEFGDLRLNGEKYGDTSNVININESDFVIKVVSQCGDVDISVQ